MIRSLLITGLVGVIPATAALAADYRTVRVTQGGNRSTLVRVPAQPPQQAPYALTAAERQGPEVGELRPVRVTQGGSRSTIILAPADHPAE